ncbi:MAG: TolC family protein [Verrucomicrobiota bacterium]
MTFLSWRRPVQSGGVLTFLCFVFCLPSLTARGLTRDEAVRLAFAQNRELGVASLEVKRAASRLRWSGRLENPEFEFSFRGDGVGTDEGESNTVVALSQSFPVTAKLRHEKNLRHYQVMLAEAEIAEKRRELAGEVDLALVELAATRAEAGVRRRLVTLNRDLVDFLSKQAELGVVSSLDLMQATLAGRTVDQQVDALAAEENERAHQITRLIGAEPETPIRDEMDFQLSLKRPGIDVSLATVLSRRPDYVLAVAKTDEALAAVTLEEAKRWEDFTLRLFVDEEEAVDAPLGLQDNTFAGVGFSIPLPLRKRNEEGVEQARINVEAAEKGLEAARFQIRSECEEAFHERDNAWKLASQASGEILQLAEENLQQFRRAYEDGKASLIQVRRAQEQVLELETASMQFLADYHRAAARVRLVTGAYPGLSIRSAKNPQN